jgi:hypothetical protein
MAQFRVSGVIRLNPKTPDGRHEQVAVRQTVTAYSTSQAFRQVRDQYAGRMCESDLTAEEVGRD